MLFRIYILLYSILFFTSFLTCGALQIKYKKSFVHLIKFISKDDKEKFKEELELRIHNHQFPPDYCDVDFTAGLNLLHMAAYNGAKNIASLLINDYDFDINASTILHSFRTSLAIAIHRDHVEFVKFILERGACGEEKNYHLDLACKSQKRKMFRFLVEKKGACITSDNISLLLKTACQSNSKKILNYIFKKKYEQISLCFWEKHSTLLHAAATQDIAKCLVKNGADVHAKDMYGRTALHFAALHLRPEIVLYLLSQGAEVNKRENHHLTPLSYVFYKNLSLSPAQVEETKKRRKCIEAFIAYGAVVDDLEEDKKKYISQGISAVIKSYEVREFKKTEEASYLG